MKARHTSLDKHLKHNVLWIEDLANVNKVVIGFSECCRHRYPPGHIKIRSVVSGGIKVNGYSGKGVTDIFIRISPESAVETVIEQISRKFNLP